MTEYEFQRFDDPDSSSADHYLVIDDDDDEIAHMRVPRSFGGRRQLYEIDERLLSTDERRRIFRAFDLWKGV